MKQARNPINDVKLLFLSALVIFMVTVVIGILNGIDLVTFSRPTITTHVHAGTLGWITLSVFGAAIWLFCSRNAVGGTLASRIHWLSLFAIGSVLLYVVAFFSGIKEIIPIFGSLVFLAIAAFFILALVQSRKTRLTIPHALILAAMVNLFIGAIIGVLWGLGNALPQPILPAGGFIGHTSAMVIGYLILVGMAITEWRLADPQVPASSDRLGLAQVLLLFIGGLTLTAGAIFDIFPLIVLNVPFEIIGVLIYLWRVGRKIGNALWLGRGSARLFGASALFLVINIGILVYIIANYADRFEEVPLGLVFAMNHIMFIGVMTNSLFGLIGELTRQRQRLYPFAEVILFWGMNIGLVGFALGLILETSLLKILFTPLMGLAIIVGAVVFARRLQKPVTDLGAA